MHHGADVQHLAGLDRALEELDSALGAARLVLIHANDSRAELGSRVDRHWHIGKGEIGREGFRVIVNHPRLRELPFILRLSRNPLDICLGGV